MGRGKGSNNKPVGRNNESRQSGSKRSSTIKLKQENERLKEENEILENRNEKLKQKIKKMESLVNLRRKADCSEAEIVYSKLFGEIGLPLQKLFALAKEEEVRAEYESILKEEIQLPIKEAFRTFNVTFTNKGISRPIRHTEPKPEGADRLAQLSLSGLDDAIKDCLGRIECAKVYEIPKCALDKAAGSLHILIETPSAELAPQRVKELAGKIEKAFRESGLFPLFRRDAEVLARPDLCARFIEVKGSELIWPGLFIEIHGKLQMYGSFQGTCCRGEWNSRNG